MEPRTFTIEAPALVVLITSMVVFSVIAVIMFGAVQLKCVEKTGRLCPLDDMAPPAAAGQVNAGAPR